MTFMAMEIEHKYLVVSDTWKPHVQRSTEIVQGYLNGGGQATVRVRIKGENAFLTIKGRSEGISRAEFEYPIPVPDARAMLDGLAEGPVVEKVRHVVDVDGHAWEVDVFAGDNEGLVMAELEVGSEDEQFTVPDWAGLEVSDDPRYYNVNLAKNPFRNWGHDG